MRAPLLPLLLAFALLAPAAGRGGGPGTGLAGRVWVLEEIDGSPFPARATMTFPAPGRIAGKGPCNGYSGNIAGPLPDFAVTGLRATRRACPALEAEGTFFAALIAMTRAETDGGRAVLSTPDGHRMIFRAE